MRNTATFVGTGVGTSLAVGLLAGGLLAGCNAPKQTQSETRMYPKAPLEHMAPVIRAEPTTAMSRLARFHKPPVVVIPADSTVPAKK